MRPVIGAAAALVAIALLGAGKEFKFFHEDLFKNPAAILVIAFVAGFSERFITGAIERIRSSQAKRNRVRSGANAPFIGQAESARLSSGIFLAANLATAVEVIWARDETSRTRRRSSRGGGVSRPESRPTRDRSDP